MVVTARDITRAEIARVVKTGERCAGDVFTTRPWIVFARAGRAFRRPATEDEADKARAIASEDCRHWQSVEARAIMTERQ